MMVHPTTTRTTHDNTTSYVPSRKRGKAPFESDHDEEGSCGATTKAIDSDVEDTDDADDVDEDQLQNRPHHRKEIYIIDNLLTADECDELIAVHDAEHHAGYINNLTITRFADVATPQSIHLALPMTHARHLCWEQLERCFGKQFELFPEFTALMAWHQGSYLQKHFDANRDYLLDRHYSAILYLNDPQEKYTNDDSLSQTERKINTIDNECRRHFVGGDLVFEFPAATAAAGSLSKRQAAAQKNEFRVQPKSGRLVCFPSTSSYIHRVDEILSGCRYCLTLWFTKSIHAMETLDSFQQQLVLFRDNDDNNTDHDDDGKTKLSITSSSIKSTKTIITFEQPWETEDQAEELMEKYMRNANLLNPSGTMKDRKIPKILTCVSEVEIRHLIAYCWWKKRMPLGDIILSSSKSEGGAGAVNHCDDDFALLSTSWKQYKEARTHGLKSAAKRWKNNGMITNVTKEEMLKNCVTIP